LGLFIIRVQFEYLVPVFDRFGKLLLAVMFYTLLQGLLDGLVDFLLQLPLQRRQFFTATVDGFSLFQ